jgi:acyl-CoA reductase-like NAD-dependent aldehyde dehydrogenase
MSALDQTAAPFTNGHTLDSIAVDDPRTGAVVGHVPELGAEEVAAAVRRARSAQPAWAALTFHQRGAALREASRRLARGREQLATTLMSETGKTREDAMLEVFSLAEALRFWAKKSESYLREERVRGKSPAVLGKRFSVKRLPLGVVGVIAPWNYPIVLGIGDAAPALMAGNAVVIKPSEHTPLSTLAVAEILHETGVPEDAFIVATGAGATGAALVDVVDMIMFTGSTRTGRKVAARAGERLIPCSLELGGKDPMIVCADADLERAANAAVTYGFLHAGQICMSVERVYVEEPAYDDFVARVTEKTRSLSLEDDTGAMTFPPQMDVVEQHVSDALAKGATAVTGGRRREGAGRWYEPTVLVDVDHSMQCMTEETFGPTLPIMRVRDVDQALELANDSPYGLNSSVFTKDVAKGEAIAARIAAGSACVNDALLNFNDHQVPFGGAKESGLGSRHGADGIRKYTQPQTVMSQRFAPKKDAHFLPANKKLGAFMERGMAWWYGR